MVYSYLFRAEHKSISKEMQQDIEWMGHRLQVKSHVSKHKVMLVDKTTL